MTNNWLHGVLLAAALAAGGLRLWQGSEEPMQVLAVVALALIAVSAIFWLSRVRSTRRWRRALDVYVERALAHEATANRGVSL